MITKYKNITVSKASDGGAESKLPTHRLVVTDENYQHKKDVGSFWTREGTYGKFLSGKMGDARSYTNKEGEQVNVPGYVIVREDELDALIKKAGQDTYEVNADKQFEVIASGVDTSRKSHDPISNQDISLDSIPF